MNDKVSPAIANYGKNVGKLEMDYLTSEVGFSSFFETKFEFFKF